MEKSIHSDQYAALLKVLTRKRVDSGITQTQIAEKLGMTQSAYSKLERGELRIDVIQLRAILLATGTALVDFIKEFEAEIAAAGGKSRGSRARGK